MRSIRFFLITLFVGLFFSLPGLAFARGGCFSADVNILTPTGQKPIGLLQDGDQVISLNLQTNQKQVSTVSSVESFDEPEYYLLNGQTKVTPTHPYYVNRQGQQRLVEVADLQVGDLLMTDQLEQQPLRTIVRVPSSLHVYNLLNVLPNNNYFANGILVHNKGGGGCFLATTQISTPQGLKPISTLKAGDQLVSLNAQTGQQQASTIGRVDVYEVDDYLKINGLIQTTPTHPFYRWVNGQTQLIEAGQLVVGDLLINQLGQPVPITSIESIAQKSVVYNLVDITPNNNYYADGVLVHNKGGGGGGGGGGSFGRSSSGSGTSSSCSYITDPAQKARCQQSERWQLGAWGLSMFLMFAAAALSAVKVQRVPIFKRDKSGQTFSTDSKLLQFAHKVVPGFTNLYSDNYALDDEEWKAIPPRSQISPQKYASFISGDQLNAQVTKLFERYQHDWTHKNFGSMIDYVEEPFFSRQKAVFSNSFGSGFDIVYDPQVTAVVPVKVTSSEDGLIIRLQINAQMTNFEILSADLSVGSGEPTIRKFTEFWTVRIAPDGQLWLQKIQQLSAETKWKRWLSRLSILAAIGIIFIPMIPVASLYTGALPSSSAAPSTATTSAALNIPSLSASGIFNQINFLRTANGAPKLSNSIELCTLAQKQADAVLQGQQPFETIAKSYTGAGIVETEVLNATTNDRVVQIWQDNPQNRQILLMSTKDGILYQKGCVATAVNGQKSVTVLMLGDK